MQLKSDHSGLKSLKVPTAFPDLWCLLTGYRIGHLGGIRGFVYSFVSDVEVQVVHALHHPALGLVSHLGRLFDGDTCRENRATSGTAAGTFQTSEGPSITLTAGGGFLHIRLAAGGAQGEYSHDGTMNCGSVFPAYPSLVYLQEKDVTPHHTGLTQQKPTPAPPNLYARSSVLLTATSHQCRRCLLLVWVEAQSLETAIKRPIMSDRAAEEIR